MILLGRQTWRLPGLDFICFSALVGTGYRPLKWIKPQLTRLVGEAPVGDGWLHRMHDGHQVADATGLDWDDHDKRIALAQIMRLAGVPGAAGDCFLDEVAPDDG